MSRPRISAIVHVCDRIRRRGQRARAARLLLAAAAAVPSFALRGGFWRNLVHASLPTRRG